MRGHTVARCQTTFVVAGLGIDLVEVSRIATAMANPRFVMRVLTPAEREFCTTPTQVAGRWAAKEAIAKALPWSLSWQDVEILPGASGAPVVRVVHAEFDASVHGLHVSITHERSMAAAVAVFEIS